MFFKAERQQLNFFFRARDSQQATTNENTAINGCLTRDTCVGIINSHFDFNIENLCDAFNFAFVPARSLNPLNRDVILAVGQHCERDTSTRINRGKL